MAGKDHSSAVSGCNITHRPSSRTFPRLSAEDFLEASSDDELERCQLYHEFMSKMSSDLQSLHRSLVSDMFHGLVEYMSNNSTTFTRDTSHTTRHATLPTAALITGINMPDHSAMYNHLVQLIINNATPHVSLLTSRECSSLKSAMIKLITDIMNSKIDGDDTAAEGALRGKTSRVNMLNLCSWYETHGNAKPVVVLIQDLEQCSARVLQDLIAILSQYLSRIPFILLLDIATNMYSLHNMLPHSVLSLMHIYKFRCKDATDYLTAVVDRLIYSGLYPFKLGGSVLAAMIDQCIQFDFSVHNAISWYQSCMFDHYLSNPVTILCRRLEELDWCIDQLNHHHLTQLRLLPSFRAYCETNCLTDPIRINQYKYNDSKLKALLRDQLKCMNDHHRWFVAALRCLLLASDMLVSKPFGNKLREAHLLLLSSKGEGWQAYHSMMTKLRYLGREELEHLLDSIIAELTSDSSLNESSAAGFADIISSLKTYKERLNNMDNAAGDDEQQQQSRRRPIRSPRRSECEGYLKSTPRQTLFDLQHDLKRRNVKRSHTVYETIRDGLLTYLDTDLYSKYLINPERCMFNEIYYHKGSAFLNSQFSAAVADHCKWSLRNPHVYLQRGESEWCVKPDVCQVYKLYTESSRLINLHDWMMSFFALVQSRDDAENEADGSAIDQKLLLRFLSTISSMQHMGYSKPTSRKVDHVLRLEWQPPIRSG